MGTSPARGTRRPSRIVRRVVGGALTAMLIFGATEPITAGGTPAHTADSAACCPLTIGATAPCVTIVHDGSEGTPSAKLRSLLAPLRRRRQTPADLPPRHHPQNAFSLGEEREASLGEELSLGEGVYTRFIRRAAVIHGESLYLIPVARACDDGRVVHEVLFLQTVWPTPGGGTLGGNNGPSTAASIKREGITGGIGESGTGTAGTENPTGVVPNGVAKVTLVFPREHGFPASVTVRVVDNVYAAFVPYTASGEGVAPRPERIVWRSPRGKVLKTLPF
jgi:hypothetical protein